MLIEPLENRLLLSASAYSLSDVSGEGFKAIGNGPSINDNGYVAFTATGTNNKQNVYAVAPGASSPLPLMNAALTLPDTGSNGGTQTFGSDVIINSMNQVLAQRQQNAKIDVGFPLNNSSVAPFTYLEAWNVTKTSGTATQLAMGDAGSAPANGLLTWLNPVEGIGNVYPSPYNTAYGLAGVLDTSFGFNDNGQAAYAALSEQRASVLAVGPQADSQLDYQISSSGLTLNAKIADDGSIVVSNGAGIILLSSDLQSQNVLVSSSNGFSNVGLNPGISENGDFIAFYAELSTAGATAYNTTLSSAYLPLTAGPGIFVAEKTSSGSWVIQQAARVGGDGHLSGFVPSDAISISLTNETTGQVTVAFVGLDALARGAQGVFTSSILTMTGSTAPPTAVPQLVAVVGEAVPGLGVLSDVGLNDAINAQGIVVLWAASGSKQAVLEASPDAYVHLVSFSQNISAQYGVLGSNGDLEISYDVLNAGLAGSGAPTLDVYWATGPSLADRILASPQVQSFDLQTLVGRHTQSLNISSLDNPPQGAKDLVATVNNAGFADSVIFSDLNPDRISSELSGAPAEPTRYERVRQWLITYSGNIAYAANEFNISEIAIAGAIAWEALQNVKITLLGPGKVHPTVPQILENNPVYTPELPAQSLVTRTILLETPGGAIPYIAAIMNAYALDAEHAGFASIRQNPAILATYYNGVTGFSLSSAPAAFRKRAKVPFVAGPTMGQWVANNLAFLESVF